MSSSLKYIVVVTTIILFLFPSEIISQGKSLNTRKKELEKLNKSIKDTRKKLKNTESREKKTLKDLNTYQKHIRDVKRYLNLLDREIYELNDSISYLYKILEESGKTKEETRSAFMRIAADRLAEDLAMKKNIFSSGNYIQGRNRDSIYFSSYSSNTSDRVEEINDWMDSTEAIVNALYDKSVRQGDLKRQKESERTKLNRTVSSKKKLLKRLKNDKSYLKKRLKQKQSSAKKLKNIIAKLSKSSSSGGKKYKIPKKLPIGTLSWPSSSTKLLHGYGQYKNKSTGTVFDNPGIDIAMKTGSKVKAAAPGKVSVIHWLAGYGSLVIVDHGKDVRTVYANLSGVNVEKGAKIKRGQLIGKSGESVDGEFLHFEVWIGSTRLNPSKYLR